MRRGKLTYTDEELQDLFNSKGYIELPTSNGSLIIRSLKKHNKTAWQNAIVEFVINNKEIRLNKIDLERALNFC